MVSLPFKQRRENCRTLIAYRFSKRHCFACHTIPGQKSAYRSYYPEPQQDRQRADNFIFHFLLNQGTTINNKQALQPVMWHKMATLARLQLLCSADIPVSGFPGHSCPVYIRQNGDWKVAQPAGLPALRQFWKRAKARSYSSSMEYTYTNQVKKSDFALFQNFNATDLGILIGAVGGRRNPDDDIPVRVGRNV